MKRILLFAMVLLGVAAAASADVVKLTVDDMIHPISDEFIGRGLDFAAARRADAVLIELRTPGGLEESMRDIVQKILRSPVPAIIFVAPSGSRAASAGFFILESADIAAMAPGTNTGAAHPVDASGKNIESDMRKKVENDAAAFMRSYVAKRGRNAQVAESAVLESKAWSSDEALKDKLIDIVASDENDLFRQMVGRQITRFDGTTVRLDLTHASVVDFEMTMREQIASLFLDPSILFLVLAVGAFGLYLEFNHPGAVIPGVTGLILLIIAGYSLFSLPVRVAALALIIVAFVLFALEAKFATHGLLGICGVVSMTIGGLLLVNGPIPELRVRWWAALGVSLPLGLVTVFLMSMALKARRNKVITGSQGLVGELGVARTELTPQGKVFVHGELWDARAAVEVHTGAAVRVKSVHGLELEVELAETAQK